MSYNYFSLSNM